MGIRSNNKTFVEQATEAFEAAYDKAAPVIADAMEKADSALEEAKEKAAPMVAEAKDRTAPLVAAGAAAAIKGAAAAADAASQKAAEGRDLAQAKAAELDGSAKKKHRLRTFLLLTVVAAGLGFVVKKLTAGSGQDNWQSSYKPPPAPKATDTPIADAAAAASAEQGDDEAGASPDEAIADDADQEHPVTTPDEPAEVVDLGEKSAEKSSGKP
jgi:hypothetical protein